MLWRNGLLKSLIAIRNKMNALSRINCIESPICGRSRNRDPFCDGLNPSELRPLSHTSPIGFSTNAAA